MILICFDNRARLFYVGTMRDVRIAAAMMQAVIGDKAGNLERVRNLAAQAAEAGAELLVLPEACLTGYTVRESMKPFVEPIPGPLTDALLEIAREHHLALLAGLVEADHRDRCYLTQVLAGPEGLIGAYRKTHLGPTEKTLFTPGDRLSVIEYRGVTYGLQLCYEGHFPEVTQAQALGGAEVILIPHASPRENPKQKLERWLRYLPARAYDNTVYLAACNLAGPNHGGLTFAGVTLIIGPKGDILAQKAGLKDDLITADLKAQDLSNVKTGRMGYFLPLRRPELYDV